VHDPKTNEFAALNVTPAVLDALEKVGYERPSPIQAGAIPPLLEGRDLLGTAQTGTGKTAAFALPLLSRLDLKDVRPQILCLTPTRELAIQVSEAFRRYASQMPGFRILPVYGGQEYAGQLRNLRQGVHVVVGTPGRVMDHLRRGSLVLDGLRTSATMPPPIRKIAETYLNDPSVVRIENKTATVEHTEQLACLVHRHDKLDALARLIETSNHDGMLVFARTKSGTVELAERLTERGFACDALNGDMTQQARERTIGRFKSGALNILIATDVAARGIDVPRITHVINIDVPHDVEAYIHRIGRTGRAGQSGTAITFVTPRETRMLSSIERITRSPIRWLDVPRREQLAARRIETFKKKMLDIVAGEEDLDFFRELVREFADENGCTVEDAAAALAFQAQGERPLQPPADEMRPPRRPSPRQDRGAGPQRFEHRGKRPVRPKNGDLERFRIQVGLDHGVTPGHIVGAITNEAGLAGNSIGRIRLYAKDSTVDLPRGMPQQTLKHLQKVRIFQRPLAIRRDSGGRP